MTALIKLLSGIGVALSSALPSVVQARNAYVPGTFNYFDPAAQAVEGDVINKFTILEDQQAYSSTQSLYTDMGGAGVVEFVWASKLLNVNQSWNADYVQGNSYRYSYAYADMSELEDYGYWPNTYHYLWNHLLASGGLPLVGGYIKYAESTSSNMLTYTTKYFGLFRPLLEVYRGSSSPLGDSWWTIQQGVSPIQYLQASQSVTSSEASQYGYYMGQWHRRICYEIPNFYRAFNGVVGQSYNDGYLTGYDDGTDDAVYNYYHGLDYDAIWRDGYLAGAASHEGNIEVIDMFGMFSAVVTMPFTLMASTFDAELFADTPYAFNVSVFIYSVFIILLIWKILGLVLRGGSGGK